MTFMGFPGNETIYFIIPGYDALYYNSVILGLSEKHSSFFCKTHRHQVSPEHQYTPTNRQVLVIEKLKYK
jgi:hypothetical protein